MSVYTGSVPPASQGIDPNQYGQAGLGATTSNIWGGLVNNVRGTTRSTSSMSTYYSVTAEDWEAVQARLADLEAQVKVLKLATMDERAQQLRDSLHG